MGQLTFIIGNGLDLSLKLETEYRQFYEYVRTYGLHPDNKIYKAIEESPESWSDFEYQLGNYTEYLKNKSASEQIKEARILQSELGELIGDLAVYLKKEDDSLVAIPNGFSLNRTGFMIGINQYSQQKIINELANNWRFNFITLNYTRSLEKILKDRYDLNNGRVDVGSVLHLHGTIYEDLTLGVSDETQLFVSLPQEQKENLIKPELIASMNDGRLEEMNEIIDSSDVLVLFGTSIGDTDDYLWKSVIEWLTLSKSRYVIIHTYDPKYTDDAKVFSPVQKQYTSIIIHKLLSHSGLDGDEIQALRKQIFVIFNSKSLFYDKSVNS